MIDGYRIPADFVAPINSLDEVWVPTDFSRNVLQASGVQEYKVCQRPAVPPFMYRFLFLFVHDCEPLTAQMLGFWCSFQAVANSTAMV